MPSPATQPASAVLADIMRGKSPREAADLLRAMADQIDVDADGPCEPCHFRFGGRVEALKPSAYLLLEYAWKRRHRPIQIDFATAEVWGPSPAPHALRSALANISLAMTATGYPQRLCRRGMFLIFE